MLQFLAGAFLRCLLLGPSRCPSVYTLFKSRFFLRNTGCSVSWPFSYLWLPQRVVGSEHAGPGLAVGDARKGLRLGFTDPKVRFRPFPGWSPQGPLGVVQVMTSLCRLPRELGRRGWGPLLGCQSRCCVCLVKSVPADGPHLPGVGQEQRPGSETQL